MLTDDGQRLRMYVSIVTVKLRATVFDEPTDQVTKSAATLLGALLPGASSGALRPTNREFDPCSLSRYERYEQTLERFKVQSINQSII